MKVSELLEHIRRREAGVTAAELVPILLPESIAGLDWKDWAEGHAKAEAEIREQLDGMAARKMLRKPTRSGRYRAGPSAAAYRAQGLHGESEPVDQWRGPQETESEAEDDGT